MRIKRKLSPEQKLDKVLESTGYTKQQILDWLTVNVDETGKTFSEIRTALGKTVEELPDGFIQAIAEFYSKAFEVEL